MPFRPPPTAISCSPPTAGCDVIDLAMQTGELNVDLERLPETMLPAGNLEDFGNMDGSSLYQTFDEVYELDEKVC